MISQTSKRTLLFLATFLLTVSILIASVRLSGSSYGTKPPLPATADLASFSALAPIDAHVHLYKDDPAFGTLLKRLNLRVFERVPGSASPAKFTMPADVRQAVLAA